MTVLDPHPKGLPPKAGLGPGLGDDGVIVSVGYHFLIELTPQTRPPPLLRPSKLKLPKKKTPEKRKRKRNTGRGISPADMLLGKRGEPSSASSQDVLLAFFEFLSYSS